MKAPADTPPALTVSALTAGIKGLVENRYTRIYVEGEISGWRVFPSGHAYFTLKDPGAQIACVMFKSSLERCKARPLLADGAKVLVYANATVYPPRGNYQLTVLAAKAVGAGDLMRRYLELKAKLEAEGLFAAARKRPLPFLPRRIGLVTSSAGAVVHDMCRVLTRRFPALEIRLYPALVQGEEAPATLVAGLDWFNGNTDWKADLLIVGRGGGSFEDLFCFNDEALVRAVAASRIPVISAVGHETDYTLCDFAADVRAGTPSMAAERAVPERAELLRRLQRLEDALAAAMRAAYEWNAQRVDHLATLLVPALRARADGCARRLDRLGAALSPLLEKQQLAAEGRLARLADALAASSRLRVRDLSAHVNELAAKLDMLSPYAVLERGYSITTTAAGEIVRAPSDVRKGDVIHTRLGKGAISSTVF